MCQRQQGLITHESCFMCLSLSFITLMHKLSLQLWFVYSSTSFITRCVSDILAASPSTLFPFFFLLSLCFHHFFLHDCFIHPFSLSFLSSLSFYPFFLPSHPFFPFSSPPSPFFFFLPLPPPPPKCSAELLTAEKAKNDRTLRIATRQ